jgi:phosphoglycolate phosphatase
MHPASRPDLVVFDLDGTLVDSDEALVRTFLALGVPRDQVTFGHPIEVECARLGIDAAEYVATYDDGEAQPFPGVEEMLARLARWSVCSNKTKGSGIAELTRLGWEPEFALFADDFGGEPKRLGPVLELLGVAAERVVFVGDTHHDLVCARDAGTSFAWAGWNPRVSTGSGVVLERPSDLLDLVSATS